MPDLDLDELARLAKAATPGRWFTGFTPHYLSAGQDADGGPRSCHPITIRSPEHTEEIATVWTYLLPTEANAALIAAAVNALPALIASARRLAAVEGAARELMDAELAAGMHADIASPAYPRLTAARGAIYALLDAALEGPKP